MDSKLQVLGVDGGSTKTHLAVADGEGKLIGRYSAGSSNHQSTDRASENLRLLFRPLEGQSFAAGVFTLSGWDFPADQKILRTAVDQALDDQNIRIETKIFENDIYAVLKSGMGAGTRGVCLAAGTGVLGAAWNGSRRFRNYGFGDLSGEWGGGGDIGQEAVRIVLSAAQGREKQQSDLLEAALDFFNVPSVYALAEKVCLDDFDWNQFSRFSARVFEGWKNGGEGAAGVVRKAGTEYAKTVNGLLLSVGLKNAPIVLGGGIFQRNGVLPGFMENMRIPAEKRDIRLIRSDPVFGSLAWALEETGITTEEIEKFIEIERL